MSLILDALKKLEREKAASRKGPVDIVPAIMNSRTQRPSFAGWKLPVVIIGVIAATAAVTTAVVIVLAPRGARSVSPASAVAENARPAAPVPAPRVPHDDKINAEQARGRFAAEAADARPVVTPQPLPPANRHARVRQPDTMPAAESSRETTVNTNAPSPDLRVSGIAWQDDRADRRAVVNGVLVGEGTVVGGARIVRILQDRVRFSRSGETFDISVAGASQAK